MGNKDTSNDPNKEREKGDPFNVTFLYTEKERINKKISTLSNWDLEKRRKEFNPPFQFIRKDILEKMGEVLYKYIKKHIKNPANYQNFQFYFWPGFTTLEGKRVFIWKETDIDNKDHYYSGIGFDNDGEFRDCPTTLAYNQVLNADADIFIFKGTDFYPGSTHYFRVNQRTVNEKGEKRYSELRKYCKGNKNDSHIFKALHITTDDNFKEEEESNHAILITIGKQELKDSGKKIKGKLDDFLNEQNNKMGEDQYRYKWPYDVLPYETKIQNDEKNITPEILTKRCEECQQEVIDIQTHLYSYWIAKTLGEEKTFDDANKYEFNQNLKQLLKKQNLLKSKDKIDFFKQIEKQKLKKSTNPDGFRNVFFDHWYTIFHEGFSIEEDMGSSMLLSNYEIPHQLLYHVSSWIEDIYNNLKLVESKTKTEYETKNKTRLETHKDDFSALYHIQGPYFTLFRKHLKAEGRTSPIPIVDIMEYALKITRNIYNPKKDLRDEVSYYKTKKPLSIDEHLKESITRVNTLCKDDAFLESVFEINNNEQRKHIINLAENNRLINFNPFPPFKIESHKQLFEILITEILINSVKHSNKDNPHIKILVNNDTIEIQNSSIFQTQEELDKAMQNSEKFGLRICDNIAAALDIKFNLSMVKKNVVNAKLILKLKENAC